jgi:predicted RNase H-like HicB family nuclease
MPMKSPAMPPPTSQRERSDASPISEFVAAIIAAFRRLFGGPEQRNDVERHADGVTHSVEWSLQVCVEPDPIDGGFIAECLNLPGCMSQGETEEEALENLIDAATAVIAVRMQSHLKDAEAHAEVAEPSGAGGRLVTLAIS